MKRMLAALVGLWVCVGIASARDWVNVYEDDNMQVYIDFDSIVLYEDGTTQVWQRWNYIKPKKWDNGNSLSYYIYRVEYNSDFSMSAAVSKSLFYDTSGKIIDSEAPNYLYDYLIPDSIGEMVAKQVELYMKNKYRR